MPRKISLEEKFTASWPPSNWQDITLLLAVSGGCDSIALFRAMLAIREIGAGKLLVGHFNHGLRGEDSDTDQTFVVSLCKKYKIQCFCERVDPTHLTTQAGDGIEAAARKARYEFLQKTAHQAGARYVVTAHTADDQVETILHRIVRGTGLSGLSGIRRARALDPSLSLIRPLLGFRRSELEAYLAELQQPFREDASNTDLRFTRNRIRHQLLPMLAKGFNPAVHDAILRLGNLSAEAQDMIDTQAAQLMKECVSFAQPFSATVQLKPLRSASRYLVREMFIQLWQRQGWPLQAMGFEQWEQLAQISMTPAKGKFASQMLPGEVRIKKQGEQLELTRPEK